MRRHFPFLVLVLLCALALAGCRSSDPKSAYLEALRLEEEGKHEAALRMYEALLPAAEPGEQRWVAEIFLRIGECYLRLERPAEAFAALQRSLESLPQNVSAHLRLSELYLAAGALERSLEHAHQVLEREPTSLDALAVVGLAHTLRGDVVEARQALLRVLALDPGRTHVALALADIYGREGRVEEARLVLARAANAAPGQSAAWLALARLEEQIGDAESAEEHYRRAVFTEDNAETNLRLAQFLQRMARLEEAEQVLRRVDTIVSKDSTTLPDFEMAAGRPAMALHRYRVAFYSAGRPGEDGRKAGRQEAQLVARIVAAELEAGQPAAAAATLERYRERLDAATAAVLQAEIALALADLPQARRHAGQAANLAPASPAARYVQGAVLYRTGDHAEARAEWQAALEQDPAFVPARLALAAAALVAGDAGEAEGYVTPVVRDEPANLRALLLFGRALLAQERFDAAGTIARRAQAVGGGSIEPVLLLGDIALQAGRLPEALARFQQAALEEPESYAAIEGLTSVYRAGGVDRALLRRMETVAGNAPGSAVLMEVTGRLYGEMGLLDDAQRCLQRALELDAQRSSAAAMLAAVQARAGARQAAAESAMRSGGYAAALLAALQFEEKNDLESAAREYEAALRQGERSGTAANNLAWLYARQERELDRALELAQQARLLAPRNPAVLDTLGFVHLQRREYTHAIAVLESAARLAADPRADAHEPQVVLAGIRRHLAEAYLRAGRSEDAARLQALTP